MWFIITWSNDTNYDDLFFVLASKGVPRKFTSEASAKAWAKRNCTDNYKILFIE